MSACPFADQSRRYDRDFSGSYTGGPNKGVAHTTETSTLPGYDGGSMAPHLTLLPDIARKIVIGYQHFDSARPARALVNADGGVQTNNDGAFQIELVGTCVLGGPGLFWPDAPDWAIEGARRFIEWANDDRGIPDHGPPQGWLPYPDSYGATRVRFSQSGWDSYAGWCGHQHVPENDHGDPGDMSALFITPKEEPDMTPAQEKQLAQVAKQMASLTTKVDRLYDDYAFGRKGVHSDKRVARWLKGINNRTQWTYDRIRRANDVTEKTLTTAAGVVPAVKALAESSDVDAKAITVAVEQAIQEAFSQVASRLAAEEPDKELED
ncbi:hypothetical protein H9L10_03485 [Phycicoccus endophyticus]|uniref:Uncharacterized protein n=1 Tax=Phycicoccus endophyticus TaxID=1690220 RepID=A0A7G9R3F6_9MICO|nr:hypothetical protein [Phycicoccus endophyticus]NHI19887.1 hypothetical protein [Phycicoccus endophyticus]QNN50131.1 hypothetical protein H9L10_03485 [Phycicoccus endophyticus]GGL27762.1 hypothetical protein GCM10012283_07460 [Phycicoccus endophyticus]